MPIPKLYYAKYEAQHRPLPMISNQKLNDYVKELCKLAGIIDLVEIVRFRGIKRRSNHLSEIRIDRSTYRPQNFCHFVTGKGNECRGSNGNHWPQRL